MEIIRHTKFVAQVALIIASVALFTWLLWHPYFADPDSFYHIGVAQQMAMQRSLVIDFPALPLTSLAATFADQAWLYHVLLIPFLSFFGPVAGMKLFSVLLASAVIISVWCIASRWRAPYPWLFPAVVLLTAPFVFRLALGKPSSAAILISIWGIYALIEKKYWMLFAVSVAFAWTHGSWPLLMGISALAALLQRDGRICAPSLAGTALGLVLNPYFPANVTFFWHQTVLIGFLGFRDSLGVGREWYPYPLADFISDHALLLSLAALAIFTMFMRRDRTPMAYALLWSSAALFAMTLRANRNVEFLIPFLILLCAWIFSAHKEWLAAMLARLSFRRSAAALCAVVVLVSAIQTLKLKPLLARGYRSDAFAGVARWLAGHAAPGTLIINTRWEDFPALWYRNPQLRYVIGLDPAFLYLQSPGTYHAWQRFTQGTFTADPALVKNAFGSTVIVIKKEFQTLFDRLHASFLWTLAYEDGEAWIFMTEGSDAF